MEDNKKRESNKYEPLASFLDDRSVSPDEYGVLSEEELQKLIFLWDKCNPPQVDTGGIWNKTLRKIKEEEMQEAVPVRKHSAFMLVCGLVAASVAFLFGFSYFLLQEDSIVDERGKMEQIMLAYKDGEEVKEVTLVVSDNKKIEIANNAQVAYTRTGEVNVNASQLNEVVVVEETGVTEKAELAEEYNQIIVPKGRRSMVVLADNSKMWVNSGSKVIYPRTFVGEKREIFVEGEVFLKVARDEAKPFVVNTAAFEVEVLGTSFNVSAPGNSAQADVVLVDGEVDVKDCQERHVKMKPNERVELNEAGVVKVEKVNAMDYVHWVDGVWMLNGKPLKEVLRYLTEYYGQTVCCDSSVENEPFYGKLFLNEELNEVLESIRQTLPATLSDCENVIYIDND